jgi:general secretion pathway protein C
MSYIRLPGFLTAVEPGKFIAMGVVVIMSGLFLTQVIRAFQVDSSMGANQTKASKPSPKVTLDANALLFRKPLFGDYVPDIATADIKQSTLDVRVVGIMYSLKKESAQVLLQEAGGEERTYIMGDTLKGGAVIKRIEKTGVIVLYKGALERLKLPKNELHFDEPEKPLFGE